MDKSIKDKVLEEGAEYNARLMKEAMERNLRKGINPNASFASTTTAAAVGGGNTFTGRNGNNNGHSDDSSVGSSIASRYVQYIFCEVIELALQLILLISDTRYSHYYAYFTFAHSLTFLCYLSSRTSSSPPLALPLRVSTTTTTTSYPSTAGIDI